MPTCGVFMSRTSLQQTRAQYQLFRHHAGLPPSLAKAPAPPASANLLLFSKGTGFSPFGQQLWQNASQEAQLSPLNLKARQVPFRFWETAYEQLRKRARACQADSGSLQPPLRRPLSKGSFLTELEPNRYYLLDSLRGHLRPGASYEFSAWLYLPYHNSDRLHVSELRFQFLDEQGQPFQEGHNFALWSMPSGLQRHGNWLLAEQRFNAPSGSTFSGIRVWSAIALDTLGIRRIQIRPAGTDICRQTPEGFSLNNRIISDSSGVPAEQAIISSGAPREPARRGAKSSPARATTRAN